VSGYYGRAVVAILLGSVACVAPAQGQELNAANLARIVPGKSTAGEVRALLGPPSRIARSRVHQGEQWAYPFRSDHAWRVFWVELSTDGVVREASEQPDYDRDPRFRGG